MKEINLNNEYDQDEFDNEVKILKKLNTAEESHIIRFIDHAII